MIDYGVLGGLLEWKQIDGFTAERKHNSKDRLRQYNESNTKRVVRISAWTSYSIVAVISILVLRMR
jgi:hypothetical protein